MIYCEYNFHFEKIRQNNRILSVPILKNTCINCKFKEECHIPKFNSIKKNNEFLIDNLLQLKEYIEECIIEYNRLDSEIKDGKYQDAYTFDLIMLDDVPNKDESIVHKADEYGVLNQYTVNEYLELYPQDIHKKKLVGIHKVKTVSDIVVGLNKQELEEDLKWVNEELRILNQANKKYIKRS